MHVAYIAAVDQSTSATKAFLLNSEGRVVRRASLAHRQFYPQDGFAEHDADEIWRNTRQAIAEVSEGIRLSAIAVTNQRETSVLWSRKTGEPLCPAIVWQDVREGAWCAERTGFSDRIRKKTGLSLSPYYSAAKISGALRSHPEWNIDDVCCGTVDAYLIYRMTDGKRFCTDVSNASRTQLMNLETLSWDSELCSFFGIPEYCLPKISPSDASFGETADGVPITGIMGDSHASLFGHGCHTSGTVKTTYGTGSSVMMNTGFSPVFSSHGLSASVGYGFRGKTTYVLEGNITCSGDTLIWLRDQANIVRSIEEVEELAQSVPDTEGVYLVPAFSGLGAPYFDQDVRAVLCGMHRSTSRPHIVRAAMESMAYQNADVMEAMALDLGVPVRELHIDGGGAKNRTLMQLQSDIIPCLVTGSAADDLSALGAGWMAGLAIGVYSDFNRLASAQPGSVLYRPEMPETKRLALREGWRKAVARARIKV